MTTHIALLRGINVGGKKMVAMADLRGLMEKLGFGNPRSLLQSGNLVFDSDGRTVAELEQLLETETEKRLGVSCDFVVRTVKEWEKVIARNPFPDQAKSDPSHLVVMFLKSAVRAKQVDVVRSAIVGREVVQGDGRQLYVVYPDGIGTSKLTGALIEKTLGVRGTARNWNTVLKLASAATG